jgi:hypothetical protein
MPVGGPNSQLDTADANPTYDAHHCVTTGDEQRINNVAQALFAA